MNESNSSLAIPGAIIVAGLIVAGAIIFNNGGFGVGALTTDTGTTVGTSKKQDGAVLENSRPREVTKEDHIRGNIDAKVVIIEYSDTECPFCKRFHGTLQQIINGYEPTEVAWVYRHFPIPQLHSKAEREAVALECAAKLGGNDAFWAYTDQIYEITPSNDGLDLALLPEIAKDVGLDVDDFEACILDEDLLKKVRADRDEAVATGGRGTPHSLIISDDQIVSIPGAQPFEQIKAAVDQMLSDE